MSQNTLLNYVTSPHNTQLAKKVVHIFGIILMDSGRLDVSVSTVKKHIILRYKMQSHSHVCLSF
jgi:hypothetical protein